jgi:hypothetical protein
VSERCIGCGAIGCRQLFRDLCAREAPDHQLLVDAYAAQHPGDASRRAIESVAVHLISLCLQIEDGATPARAREAIVAALAVAYRFVRLDPPAWSGALTIANVVAGADVRAWAESVWRAWAPHHATVRGWINVSS